MPRGDALQRSLAMGIDVGGTFTDIVIHDPATGRQLSHKEPTTPADPARGAMAGIDRLLRAGAIEARELGRVVHATTLFSNALIERKGAPTGLITTAGFRDTLEIGRERKFELYDLNIVKPTPLVPRHLRLEVPERTLVDGSVRLALDEGAVLAAAARLWEEGITSAAIVFLHSYANPCHERRAVDLIAKRFPGIALSASVDVAPEIREYERVSTTVVNAYIKPLAESYLSSLAAELAARGVGAPLLLMLSNGGLTHIEDAKHTPVKLLESGPAAGVLIAAHLAQRECGDRVLAFDMGGTTAKLGTVEAGEPSIGYGFEVARARRFAPGSGLPVRISTVELIEIGAGGGSIAHLDEIGLLKVGPTSAGADPGPAAYRKGGQQPTVTDAAFVLGYLDPAYFAGGSMAVDASAAAAALGPLATRAKLGSVELAWGILDLVNENMANAARVHIAEHGKDPRHYTLIATGGAGPLHASFVAKKLGLSRLLAPRAAGVASALGLLIAPARADRVATIARPVDTIAWPDLEATFARLEREALGVLETTLRHRTAAKIVRLADMRYVGQASELVVPLPSGPYGCASRAHFLEAFERSYRAAFTRTPPATRIEIINVRVCATMTITGPAPSLHRPAGEAAHAIKGSRAVYLPESGFQATPVYDRDALSAGQVGHGPAIVEERSSTLFVGPGGRFEVLASGNIIVTIG
jgi:N-methylhydantoinase A